MNSTPSSPRSAGQSNRRWIQTIFLVCALIFGPFSCKKAVFKKSAEYLNVVADGVSILEKANKDYGKSLLDAVTNAKEMIQEELLNAGKNAPQAPNHVAMLPEVARQWMSDWNDVVSSTKDLENKINEVSPKIDEWFQELDEYTLRIKKVSILDGAQRKNEELFEAWKDLKEDLELRMVEAGHLLDRGNDISNSMLAAAKRRQINGAMGELVNYSEQSGDLVYDIDALYEKGLAVSSAVDKSLNLFSNNYAAFGDDNR